ncbi:hypothetical protein Agub_g12766 [Astrephomene gubernaculifera]|uniref:F-box domain-containing protein n=1 Tax=Astrephomene gubernaculifera TaxID=47775 RepID=A0AAD3DYN9_9CHLO|nr:hypothetical protein Agub_g12766 [Astrephomene gubernaculifera]
MALEATEGRLAEVLPEIADRICEQFIFDGASLLKLGEVNTFWRQRVRDPQLWARLVKERFGEEEIPPPAQPAVPLPGWCFFPGLDSPGHDVKGPAQAPGGGGAGGAQLTPAALAARAEAVGACAFNTNGCVKRALLPLHRWQRFSYSPGAGLYVREAAVVAELGLPPPPPLPQEAAEPQARPPALPGWTFFPLLDSPGWEVRHPATGEDHFRSSCASLAELARVAALFPAAAAAEGGGGDEGGGAGCEAFNTAGQLKRWVEPQIHWRYLGSPGSSSWEGLYVRDEVVRQRGLLPPLPGGRLHPLLRFFQQGRMRAAAARDVAVTWLNGTYLVRRQDPELAGGGEEEGGAAAAGLAAAAAVAGGQGAGGGEQAAPAPAPAPAAPPPLQVVELRSVCWLDLRGCFRGLAPGRYRVAWVLRLTPDCNLERINVRTQLTARRPCAVLDRTAAAAAGAGAAAAAAGAGAGAGAGEDGAGGGCPAAVGSELSRVVVGRGELRGHLGAGWFQQACGEFRLPYSRGEGGGGQVYDVDVVLWDHEGNWKQGMWFREVVLERVE